MSIRPGISRPWIALCRVLLFFLSSAILLAVCAPFFSRLPGPWSQAAIGAITTLATFTLTVIFLRWDLLNLADVGVAPKRQSVIRLGIGFGIGAILVALRASVVTLAGHLRWARASEADLGAAGLALLAYLLLAAREELAFRGYPLRRLERSFGMWVAQFVVASVFALEHVAGGYTWTSALLGAFVGSLLFGMAALATRGLALPIGLHAAWNFGEWILGEKNLSGLWKPIVEQGYSAYVDNMGRIAYLLAFGSATIGFWLYEKYRKPRTAKAADLTDKSFISTI